MFKNYTGRYKVVLPSGDDPTSYNYRVKAEYKTRWGFTKWEDVMGIDAHNLDLSKQFITKHWESIQKQKNFQSVFDMNNPNDVYREGDI